MNSFSNHKIKDEFLSACFWTAWYICGVNNINLTVKFMCGEKNIYADILSQWFFHKNKVDMNVKELLRCQLVYPYSNLMLPVFSI